MSEESRDATRKRTSSAGTRKVFLRIPENYRELPEEEQMKIAGELAERLQEGMQQQSPQINPESQEDFAQVTWDEVRNHIVQRLFIDDKWRVEGHQQLVWWPWFLKQEIAVTATDTIITGDRTDMMLRITATTSTLRVADRDLGLQIAAEANRQFPYGAFILDDGVVRATSSVALNPLCRGMLTAFHQAALIQATLAHQVANAYSDTPGIDVPASGHPESGRRQEPDELLRIYSGEKYALPRLQGFDEHLRAIRPIYRHLLLDGGFEAGFANDDVDFFNGDGLDVAVGRIEGDLLERRFGTGLVVMTRFLNPGTRVPAHDVNLMNQQISQLPHATQLGPVLGDERALQYGLHTRTYLDEGFLGSVRGTKQPDRLAIEIVNAVCHCAGAVQMLLASSD